MKLKHLDLYIRSMGKLLKVEYWFEENLDGVAEANDFMEKHPELAVVAEQDGMILLANKYDRGLPISKREDHD